MASSSCTQPNGHDPAKLLDELGKAFRGDQLSFKPYACGRPQHAMLDAAIAARNELGLGTATDLSEIADVRATAAAATIAEQINGASHKRRPTQIVEAQFALPYLVAAGVVHGRVGITEVADIHNIEVLNLARRIAGVAAEGGSSGITICLRDGRAVTVAIGPPLGTPETLGSEQLLSSSRTVRATPHGSCRRCRIWGSEHDPPP